LPIASKMLLNLYKAIKREIPTYTVKKEFNNGTHI